MLRHVMVGRPAPLRADASVTVQCDLIQYAQHRVPEVRRKFKASARQVQIKSERGGMVRLGRSCMTGAGHCVAAKGEYTAG